MTNFLTVSINVFSHLDNPYTLNWIGNIIRFLLESVGNMGLGIIIFTLCLKLLTLPLDIYSRVSMRKNNLKMERMRPQLEKLQRQYANTPDVYNQKMQALYKKEGYSMLSSCLPTIVTLVIFIIVINQFTNYSSYNNLMVIDGMTVAYNTAITEIDDGIVYKEYNDDNELIAAYLNEQTAFDNEAFKDVRDAGITKTNSTENSYEATYTATDINKLGAFIKSLNEKDFKDVLVGEDEAILFDGTNYSFNTAFFKDKTDAEINSIVTAKVMEYVYGDYITANVLQAGRTAAAEYYRENIPSFLWVKNIWECDLPWKHPVKQNFSEYRFTIREGCSAKEANIAMDDAQYAELTYDLKKEKNSANGYLILVVLSIGVMLLSQFITNKTQKAQLELQSVDGQAAQTSKMMMWMMPIMFGFFAFVYTASFSIYMVVSSAVATGTTLIINYFVEKAFAKKIEKETIENDGRSYKKVNQQTNSKNKK